MLNVVIRNEAEHAFLRKDGLIVVDRAVAKMEGQLRCDLIAPHSLRRIAGRDDLPV